MMGREKHGAMIGLICLLMGLFACAAAQEQVTYLGEYGEEQVCESYVPLTTTLQGGRWYVISGRKQVTHRFQVQNASNNNPAHLILIDKADWQVTGGIEVNEGQALMIYAQTTDEDIMGSLEIQGKGGAGIGSRDGKKAGAITICGGRITVQGGKDGYSSSAGIGGGDNGDGGRVVIRGGVVKASGATSDTFGIFSIGGGAGIGGGNEGRGGEVTITGGRVEALGGRLAAGIGGGDNGDNDITIIYGGDVTALGGCSGAGIGGGERGDGGAITIYGGQVNAYGGDEAAGIGGGNEYGKGGTITIHGGTVWASCIGDYGAGIGGGDKGGAGTIRINGGETTAIGGKDAAGIGAGDAGKGGSISLCGGKIRAEGRNHDALGGKECRISGDHQAGFLMILNGAGTLLGQVNAGDQMPSVKNIKMMRIVIDCAGKDVPYLDTQGHLQNCSDYTLLTGDVQTLEGGQWYVVMGGVVINERLRVVNSSAENPAHLILKDYCSLEAASGIQVGGSNALTIYAQTMGELEMGKLNAVGKSFTGQEGNAGIGADYGERCGTITIAGGNITAIGGLKRVGVFGGAGAAGIGASVGGAGGRVIICNGMVNAVGANGAVSGGAGIGGGAGGGDGGEVTLYGGIVRATGGRGRDDDSHGAGIGGGPETNGARVTFYGGTIIAEGRLRSIGGGVGAREQGAVFFRHEQSNVYVYGRNGWAIDRFESGDENHQDVFSGLDYVRIVMPPKKTEQLLQGGAGMIQAPGITAENVLKTHEEKLRSGLMGTCRQYAAAAQGGQEEQLEAVRQEIARIDAALTVLDQVAQTECAIESLPQQLNPADAQQVEALRAAQQQLAALSAHGRSLVSGALIEKLERLSRQLDAGGGALPQTGDDSQLTLWLALLALSMAGVLVWRRRRTA